MPDAEIGVRIDPAGLGDIEQHLVAGDLLVGLDQEFKVRQPVAIVRQLQAPDHDVSGAAIGRDVADAERALEQAIGQLGKAAVMHHEIRPDFRLDRIRHDRSRLGGLGIHQLVVRPDLDDAGDGAALRIAKRHRDVGAVSVRGDGDRRAAALAALPLPVRRLDEAAAVNHIPGDPILGP
jgi:hypothetical protein